MDKQEILSTLSSSDADLLCQAVEASCEMLKNEPFGELAYDLRGIITHAASHPEELEQITAYCVAKKHEIPFLIPGVSIPGVPGGQGGDAKTVLNAIANGGGKRKFHVLNSSSGLNFAWQRNNTPANFANDCVDALERLADSLR